MAFVRNLYSVIYQEDKSTISFFIFLITAIAFGVWFAFNQVNAVSTAGIAYYPTNYFLLTVFKCVLTLLVIYSFNRLIISYISDRVRPESLALSYCLLWLVLFAMPISLIALGVIFLQFLVLLYCLKKADYVSLCKRYLVDSFVLIILFITHVIFTSALSPLHWDMALLTANGATSSTVYPAATVFRGFVLAKQYSFSFVDHAHWAGIMNPPATCNSPFVQLVAFLLNLPSVSIEAFLKLIMSVNLLLAILGSFGFYLFLKYAGKLNSYFSLFGGILFFFSGTPFMFAMFKVDAGIFLSPYAAFPYALLFMSLAFMQKDKRWACWAGVALASPFFFIASHPEGIIYLIMFFGIYATGLCLFNTAQSLQSRIVLLLLSIFSFVGLTAFAVLPIMWDRLAGNMYVFGHIGDVEATPITYYDSYIYILLSFMPACVILAKINKRLSLVYLSALFLSFGMLIVIYLTTQISVMNMLVNVLHVSIHFWVLGRLGMYFFLSVATIVLFALQEISTTCYRLIIGCLNLQRLRLANE